jgi:serine/threonine protein phosphatase PrpC
VTRYRLAGEQGELHLRVASASHAGKVRVINEDSLLAEPPVFAVADGMGGHSFGDRASATAILALHEEFDPGEATDPDQVFAAIRRANAAVRELTAWSSGADQVIAGTTLTGLAVVVDRGGSDLQWMVFNVGDSRVYRWVADDARLERISIDHSLVQELMDAGMIDEDGARRHPDRNVITRALGAADEVAAEAWLLPATQPQAFLICSDGLTKELDDARIAGLLAARAFDEGPDAGVDRLLTAALDAGGADNISVVLVHSEYARSTSSAGEGSDGVDEQTRERGRSVLSPELDDTRPRT